MLRRPRPVVIALATLTILATALRAGAGEVQAPGESVPQIPHTTGATAPEVCVLVRVHGNHTTPDADVVRLAGIVVGEPLDAGGIAAIEDRLRRSGRFAAVEVRKRHRSLAAPNEVALVILVREHPGVGAMKEPSIPGPFRRVTGSLMWMPILDYSDGYGFSYGARATFASALGGRGRLSVPLTWGATRRAALELDKPFGGPLAIRLGGGLSISRRENPHFDEHDTRREAWVSTAWPLARHLRLGARGGAGTVSFGTLDDRLVSYGADLTFDTRVNPVFPRNAVLATAGVERLASRKLSDVTRYRADLRGFIGFIGQSVVSVRVNVVRASGPVPIYEQTLVGGAGSLRGFRAGRLAGDHAWTSSLDLRIPISSRLRSARTGFTVFADAGTAWDYGTRLEDVHVLTGVGAGWFLAAPIFRLNLDVAHGIGGDTRLHVTSGFGF